MPRVSGSIKSVLLAPNEQPEWPTIFKQHPRWLASTKYDGNRCLVLSGIAFTRSMKPFPNKHLPAFLKRLIEVSRVQDYGFDMELYDSTLAHHAKHTSIFNSHDKPIPDTMGVYIFDAFERAEWESACKGVAFRHRIGTYTDIVDAFRAQGHKQYHAVKQVEVASVEELQRIFAIKVDKGFEGLMVRHPDGEYKHGRATLNQGLIYKMKPFETHDVLVVDVIQRRRLKKGVERKRDERGYMERVHAKDAYELDDNVGTIRVRFKNGTESEVNFGVGWTLERRRTEVWEPFRKSKKNIVGKVVEIKHMTIGAKDGVRIGTLVRFRPDKTAKDID